MSVLITCTSHDLPSSPITINPMTNIIIPTDTENDKVGENGIDKRLWKTWRKAMMKREEGTKKEHDEEGERMKKGFQKRGETGTGERCKIMM